MSEYNRVASLFAPWTTKIVSPSLLRRGLLGERVREERVASDLYLTVHEVDSKSPYDILHNPDSGFAVIEFLGQKGLEIRGIPTLGAVRFNDSRSPGEILTNYAERYWYPKIILRREDKVAMVGIPIEGKDFHLMAMLREFGGVPIVG